MKQQISLNSKLYDIVGRLNRRPIATFSGKISMGEEEFADYAPASAREYADCRGGIGLEFENKKSDRLWWSNSMETTNDQWFSLGGLVTSVGDLATPPLAILDFNGATYVFGTSVSKYVNAGALTEADASPLTAPTDAIVFTDGTDSYLIVCNGSDVRYASVGYGASKDWAALTTSDVKYLANFDKRLMGVDAAGTTVFYSDRDNCDNAAGGAMDSFSISGNWTYARDLFWGRLLNEDDEGLYMLTDTGLILIDFHTRTAYPIEYRCEPTNLTGRGRYWNGDIYIGVGSELRKIGKGVNIPYMIEDDGLPSDVAGYIYDITGTRNWMITCISGNTKSTILKRHTNIGGWHEVYTSTSNIRVIGYSDITDPPRLYFQEGNYVKYIVFPDKHDDITKISGYPFSASGDLYLSAYSKFSVFPKIAASLEFLTKGCSSTEKLTAYYRTDANIVNDYTANWTQIGSSVITNGHPSALKFGSNLGAAFYDIQLKVHAERGGTTTNSPKFRLCLFFVPNVSWVYDWTFTIRCDGKEALEVLTNLNTAITSGTFVKFSPDGNETKSLKYVKVENAASIGSPAESATEEMITVVVREVIPA